MNGGAPGDTFATERPDGQSAVQTPDATEVVLADLRKQLDEATEGRKRAASRARYLRHAIGNLETARGLSEVSR